MPTDGGRALLSVKVQPGARRNSLAGINGDQITVKIAAPPVKGKANQELVSYLSELLGVEKGRISVLRGTTARIKLVQVLGADREQLLKRLAGLLKDDRV